MTNIFTEYARLNFIFIRNFSVTLFSVLFATIIPAFNFVVKILETRESGAHN